MAATTGRGADLGSRTPVRRSTERLATETKHAFKTTEFAAFVVIVIAILVSAAAIKGGDTTGGGDGGTDEFTAAQAWLYVAIVTLGYLFSRGLAKSGSREPYWSGASNEQRDLNGDNR
jgi:hypothetical protein